MRAFVLVALAISCMGAVRGDVRPPVAMDGGVAERPASRAAIVFVDMQELVGRSFVEEVAAEIAGRLQLPTRVQGKGVAVAGVSVELFEREGAATLTIEPEGMRAAVNVRGLAADGAGGERLRGRVRKEMWRATVYLLGGGNTRFAHCVMKPVSSLRELDALDADSACPDVFNSVLATAGEFGVRGRRMTTYRRACEEGWAPAPTNDVQRGIWNRGKDAKERGPENAIRILPPNRRKR